MSFMQTCAFLSAVGTEGGATLMGGFADFHPFPWPRPVREKVPMTGILMKLPFLFFLPV